MNSCHRDVLKHVHKHFGFLFARGAQEIFFENPHDFDNFSLGLELPEFRVAITRDRHWITVMVGTHQAESHWAGHLWVDLSTLTMFLTGNQVMLSSDWRQKYQLDADWQLERLAKLLYHFYDQIVELYRPENFAGHKPYFYQTWEYTLSLIDRGGQAELNRVRERTALFLQSLEPPPPGR